MVRKDLDSEPNPFKMPPDQEVFHLREMERRQRQEKRQQLLNMSIVEKAQNYIEEHGPREVVRVKKPKVKRPAFDTGIKKPTELSVTKDEATQAELTEALAQLRATKRQDRLSTRDLLVKKRELFLVQMSLDLKREEIRQLEAKATKRETELAEAEALLERDAVRFDEFLKANDLEAVQSIKRAETETKRRVDKQSEIKRLTMQVLAVRSDIGKSQDQLADCRRYREFLSQLTPPEWREAHEGEEGAMYFTAPQQLLDTFTALEESNLFLIQNAQEAEEGLDLLSSQLATAKAEYEAESTNLKAQVDGLTALIAKTGGGASAAIGGDEPEQELQTLHAVVADACRAVGMDPTNQGPVELLGRLEAALESMIEAAAALPEARVIEAEVQRERERRQAVREEKLRVQKQQQEVRLQRALERAQQPPVKRTTKKPMPRSYLPKKVKKKAADANKTREVDLGNADFYS